VLIESFALNARSHQNDYNKMSAPQTSAHHKLHSDVSIGKNSHPCHEETPIVFVYLQIFFGINLLYPFLLNPYPPLVLNKLMLQLVPAFLLIAWLLLM